MSSEPLLPVYLLMGSDRPKHLRALRRLRSRFDPEAVEQLRANEELEIEAPMRLWEQRIGAVLSALRAVEARLDKGARRRAARCGVAADFCRHGA